MTATDTGVREPRTAPDYVHDFAEGDGGQKDLLGGKGANLAEMTRIGLPVPPGFVIGTDACRYYLRKGRAPAELAEQIHTHLRRLEARLGQELGGPDDPLLVSVRSGSKFSMPGMMETVLDVGLNDRSVEGLAAVSGDARFAWDSYRRLVQMYGSTVMDIPAGHFTNILRAATDRAGVPDERGLGVGELRTVVGEFKELVLHSTGRAFPQSPVRQLTEAVEAVFGSWNTERARTYRRHERIPDDLGTAVTVMAMVYGNLGADSGTGVAFTRDPATGARGVYGDYLPGAQGEDVVAGGHCTVPLAQLEQIAPDCYRELLRHLDTLERHYRDMCDVEFTIQNGTLWMLQTRVGKRTAAAAFVIAADLVHEQLIEPSEALRRVGGKQLSQLMFPAIAAQADQPVLARGVAASPGAAVGAIVLSATAARQARIPVVLVRPETTPDDLPGMIAAQGVLTSRGGKTSHAAVVARGMGKPCVCGADSVVVDEAAGTVDFAGTVLRTGDVVSLDGSGGLVYAGRAQIVPSALTRYLDTGVDVGDPAVHAARELLQEADRVRRLGVLANADTPQDAARARRLGAAGIGLCRTEHMFLGERRAMIEELILADGAAAQEAALDRLLPLQRSDFAAMLAAMDGLPVTVRLLDPPLHEFLPALESLVEQVAEADAVGRHDPAAEHDRHLLGVVRRISEHNPMLGLRGVRLGLVIPGLMRMQARAVAEAAAQLVAQGADPRPRIMIPLVADEHELRAARAIVEQAVRNVPGAPAIEVGAMVETPRAALTGARITESADFLSFGTNDLTQMTWGFSRDDAEAAFLPRYLEDGLLEHSPFETIDADGVGRLIRICVREARRARAGIGIGVCGEHAGNPDSVAFFHRAGVDYLSCSPYRLPVARLEAGRAAVDTSGTGTSGTGTPGTGTPGTGTPGIGTSGIGTSGIGTSGIGTSDTR